MATSIRAFRQQFRKLNLKAAIVETVSAKREVIADLQATQLSRGERKDGTLLPEYSARSVNEFGKRPGPWTLRDTGEFYRLIQIIRIDSTGWELSSLDEKTRLIQAKVKQRLGDSESKVFGLNKTSLEDLVNPHIRPELKRQITNQTGIKFQ